jgi:hypothetical protein
VNTKNKYRLRHRATIWVDAYARNAESSNRFHEGIQPVLSFKRQKETSKGYYATMHP